MGIKLQFIGSLLLPEGWEPEMLHEWFNTVLSAKAKEGSDVIDQFFFAYECDCIHVVWDQTDTGHHVMRLAREISEDQ